MGITFDFSSLTTYGKYKVLEFLWIEVHETNRMYRLLNRYCTDVSSIFTTLDKKKKVQKKIRKEKKTQMLTFSCFWFYRDKNKTMK